MKDNFSIQAEVYARYRPHYPPELFDFIIDKVATRDAAWDCATGNGQTAKELSAYFEKVFATDISQKQLDHAEQAPNVFYSAQPAEQTNFPDNIFDLVTVSQALHWFRFDLFFAEVRRVCKPGAWLAVWMYSLLKITPEIDRLIENYHFETLNAYWDKERKYVDENYASIHFPFEEISTPLFYIKYDWSMADLEGYFKTWSALQKFISVNNYSPVNDLMADIKPYWVKEHMPVVFPLHLRMARVTK